MIKEAEVGQLLEKKHRPLGRQGRRKDSRVVTILNIKAAYQGIKDAEATTMEKNMKKMLQKNASFSPFFTKEMKTLFRQKQNNGKCEERRDELEMQIQTNL